MRRFERSAVVVLHLALLGLSAGCRSPAPGVPLAASDPRPSALLRGFQDETGSRQALRARARLDLDAEDVKLDRPQRMAVERPARLRFEIIGLFDQLAAVIVTDGRSYAVYDAREHDLEEGLVDSGLLWRVARVDLRPSEAVDLMLGGPRPDPALRVGPSLGYENGDVSVGRVDAVGLLRERYRFDAAGRLVEFVLFDAAGQRVWRAAYADYRPIETPAGGRAAFAHQVELEFARVKARARLRFDRVSLAERLPDALFELKLPDRADRGGTLRVVARAREESATR